MPVLFSGLAFGGGGVDDGFDGGDGVGGEAGVGGVFADEVFAGGDVDADDLVSRDVGVNPLDFGAELAEDGAGVLGGCYELVGGEVADVGHVAFDEELWHGCFLSRRVRSLLLVAYSRVDLAR